MIVSHFFLSNTVKIGPRYWTPSIVSVIVTERMDELTQILAGLALCENKAKSLGDIKPALSALSRADLAVAIKLVIFFLSC